MVRYLIWIAAAEQVGLLSECAGDETQLRKCNDEACDEEQCRDCVWGPWGEFGPCGCFGLQDRHRDISVSANPCGKPCVGAKIETKTCVPNCAKEIIPRDCIMGQWTDWGECTKTCDVGQQYRSRAVEQNLRGGGEPCEEDLKETRWCNRQGCNNPMDCVLSNWTPWEKCSKSCNGGQQERTRHVEQAAKDFGLLCNDTLKAIQSCNDISCAEEVDCKWDDWVSWSACSATCGGGEKSRSRLIVIAPRHGGKLCDANDMSEVASCETQPCQDPVDCNIGAWTDWSACTCDCNGAESRTRHITSYPSNGGKGCEGPLKVIQSCNTGPENCDKAEKTTAAAVDCVLTPFTDWGKCTKTCGGGQQERNRHIHVTPNHSGKPCVGTLNEIRPCHEDPCPAKDSTEVVTPIDCQWEEWGVWNECTVSCGGGARQRARDIKVGCNSRGKPCLAQSAVDVEACNTQPCDSLPCQWGLWGSWGACTCTGLRERHRIIKNHSVNGGVPCDGAKVITQSCHPHCETPAVDCVFSPWASWSKCNVDCGGGESYRTRHVAVEESNRGKVCLGVLKDLKPCGTDPCEHAVDCSIAPWSKWTPCTSTCGGGQSFRHRNILTFSAYGGKTCTDELKEIRGCGEEDCGDTQDCKWGSWTQWSACTKTCGGGQKSRDRSVAVAPRGAGKLCDAVTKAEVESCNAHQCGQNECTDGRWSQWSDWGMCSASCGLGYQSRERSVEQRSNYCGVGLDGELSEYQPCNAKECGNEAVDCSFEAWSEWGACSCSCNGIRDRSRHLKEYARNGGASCTGSMKEVGGCNTGKCGAEEPVDCVLGQWEAWGKCTAECGGGVQNRERKVEIASRNGGRACQGSLKMVTGCNYRPCFAAMDCMWDEWTKWDTCSVECGGGQRTRYRHIKRMPSNGGKPCKAKENVQIEGCNTQECGQMMYCTWTEWGSWSGCSRTCGSGQSVRKRHLVETPSKPTQGDLAAGILAHLSDALEDDTKLHFSSEDLSMVFLMSVMTTSLLIAAGMPVYRRLLGPRASVPADD